MKKGQLTQYKIITITAVLVGSVSKSVSVQAPSDSSDMQI